MLVPQRVLLFLGMCALANAARLATFPWHACHWVGAVRGRGLLCILFRECACCTALWGGSTWKACLFNARHDPCSATSKVQTNSYCSKTSDYWQLYGLAAHGDSSALCAPSAAAHLQHNCHSSYYWQLQCLAVHVADLLCLRSPAAHLTGCDMCYSIAVATGSCRAWLCMHQLCCLRMLTCSTSVMKGPTLPELVPASSTSHACMHTMQAFARGCKGRLAGADTAAASKGA
jgi:hypothetical protein